MTIFAGVVLIFGGFALNRGAGYPVLGFAVEGIGFFLFVTGLIARRKKVA